MIKQIGKQWFVFNKVGDKKLSKGYSSYKKAVHRLQVIEFFKHKK